MTIKPSGVTGFYRLRMAADGSVSGSFVETRFSKDKPALEEAITRGFLSSINKALGSVGERFILSNPQRNAEDDFDFTVSSPNGPAYLELMEVAPLEGPYETAPAKFRPYEFARAILSGILIKSRRYPKKLGRDLFLLLYATHWTFALSPTSIACLRCWLAAEKTAFRAVFSFEPVDPEDGIPNWIYPCPPELVAGFDPESVRDNIELKLDPRRWIPVAPNLK